MHNKKLLKKVGVTAIALLVNIGGLTNLSLAEDSLQSEEYTTEALQNDIELMSANPWYGSTITLPTYATDWWLTRDRDKTRIYPGTAVDRPTYAVVSNVFRGSTTTRVGQDKYHPAGQDTIGWHTVDKNEVVLRGAFRNYTTNIHNNKVDLRWSP